MLIVVSLLSTFILLLMYKWGIIEWVQMHGNKFFSNMFNCQFCLSFWVSVILSVIAYFFTENYLTLGIPFLATPIIRKLL